MFFATKTWTIGNTIGEVHYLCWLVAKKRIASKRISCRFSSIPKHPTPRSPRHPTPRHLMLRPPRHPTPRSPRHPTPRHLMLRSPRHPTLRSPRHLMLRSPRHLAPKSSRLSVNLKRLDGRLLHVLSSGFLPSATIILSCVVSVYFVKCPNIIVVVYNWSLMCDLVD